VESVPSIEFFDTRILIEHDGKPCLLLRRQRIEEEEEPVFKLDSQHQTWGKSVYIEKRLHDGRIIKISNNATQDYNWDQQGWIHVSGN